jgi:hypothetical protein
MYSSKSVITHADQTSEAEKALQRQKFEEILGVLLSAGYFRARIATLTPFDKVRLALACPVAVLTRGSALMACSGGWWHVLVFNLVWC